jgi:malic enzyme
MADKPIVFALSNPDPEISPTDANSVRDDLIMATGRHSGTPPQKTIGYYPITYYIPQGFFLIK